MNMKLLFITCIGCAIVQFIFRLIDGIATNYRFTFFFRHGEDKPLLFGEYTYYFLLIISNKNGGPVKTLYLWRK